MEQTLEAMAAAMDGGIQLATAVRIDDSGTAWVRLPRRKPMAALRLAGVTTHQLFSAQADKSPVLTALVGRSRAVILGVVSPAASPTPVEARLDGRKVVLTGDEEVTLKCGKASITLTSSGKVLIKGEYVLTRSSGVNRIKGGAVQIN